MRFTEQMFMAGVPMRASLTRALSVRPPYDVDPMLVFLSRRTVAGIEYVDFNSYARTLQLPHGPAAMRLRITPSVVDGTFWVADSSDLDACIRRARDLFDLDAASDAIDRHLSNQPHLRRSVAAHPGLRVPGHVDGFEVAVRAIVGQQISVSGARTLLTRLVDAYGEPLDAGDDAEFRAAAASLTLTRLFPPPSRLATVDPADLPMPRSRGRALITIAAAMAAGELQLHRSADPVETRRRLLALPGIGPWTADYIALRALGHRDIFMPGDLGVRHGLQRLGVNGDASAVIDAWAPWRSYAMMHVWQALEDQAFEAPVSG